MRNPHYSHKHTLKREREKVEPRLPSAALRVEPAEAVAKQRLEHGAAPRRVPAHTTRKARGGGKAAAAAAAATAQPGRRMLLLLLLLLLLQLLLLLLHLI